MTSSSRSVTAPSELSTGIAALTNDRTSRPRHASQQLGYASCIPVAKIVNFLPRDATAIAKAILYITFVDCV